MPRLHSWSSRLHSATLLRLPSLRAFAVADSRWLDLCGMPPSFAGICLSTNIPLQCSLFQFSSAIAQGVQAHRIDNLAELADKAYLTLSVRRSQFIHSLGR